MPTPTTVALSGAKITETAPNGVITLPSGLNALADMLSLSTKQDNSVTDLAPLATDIVLSMGNITTAKVVILDADGPITVKVSGSTVAVGVTTLILFGTNITSITATNPSATTSVQVRKYLASDE